MLPRALEVLLVAVVVLLTLNVAFQFNNQQLLREIRDKLDDRPRETAYAPPSPRPLTSPSMPGQRAGAASSTAGAASPDMLSRGLTAASPRVAPSSTPQPGPADTPAPAPAPAPMPAADTLTPDASAQPAGDGQAQAAAAREGSASTSPAPQAKPQPAAPTGTDAEPKPDAAAGDSGETDAGSTAANDKAAAQDVGGSDADSAGQPEPDGQAAAGPEARSDALAGMPAPKAEALSAADEAAAQEWQTYGPTVVDVVNELWEGQYEQVIKRCDDEMANSITKASLAQAIGPRRSSHGPIKRIASHEVDNDGLAVNLHGFKVNVELQDGSRINFFVTLNDQKRISGLFLR